MVLYIFTPLDGSGSVSGQKNIFIIFLFRIKTLKIRISVPCAVSNFARLHLLLFCIFVADPRKSMLWLLCNMDQNKVPFDQQLVQCFM